MSRPEIFLGIIAAATLAAAVVQVVVLVSLGLAARRVVRLVERVEQDLRPVMGHLDGIAREAGRVAALAAVQAERADRLLADVADRAERSLGTVQTALVRPLQESMAVFAGLRAAVGALRSLRPGRSRRHMDDEDALFI